MKRFFLIIGIVVGLLACGGGAVFFFHAQFFSQSATGVNDPALQTKRLTSFFLLRKIDRFRKEAIVLQHQEEGAQLLEMLGVTELPKISCTSHEECETPAQYLMMSSCPFSSRCINQRCVVVCPLQQVTENGSGGWKSQEVECSVDTDCDCTSHDRGLCSCIEGACMAVME